MAETTDDLLQRLLQSTASLSQRQAARLAHEVREQVESEVRDLLHSAWKAALLRQLVAELEQPRPDAPRDAEAEHVSPGESLAESLAASSPEPTISSDRQPAPERSSPPSDEATGLYVYGIVSTKHSSLPSGLASVDSAFPVQMLRHDGLQAIASRVSLGEFSPDGFAERAGDLDWVEAKVRAHDQVLKAALEQGPVVPLRFGTIFHSEDDLVRLLSDDHDRLQDALFRLDGKAEWGVKVIRRSGADVDLARSRQEIEETAPPDNGSGRAYLLAKQRRRRAESQAKEESGAVARRCHEALSAAACEAVALPVNRRGTDAGEQEIILNGSYLLDHAQIEPFCGLVERLSERYRSTGAALEITGPWPPYDFVNLELSLPGSDGSITTRQ